MQEIKSLRGKLISTVINDLLTESLFEKKEDVSNILIPSLQRNLNFETELYMEDVKDFMAGRVYFHDEDDLRRCLNFTVIQTGIINTDFSESSNNR